MSAWTCEAHYVTTTGKCPLCNGMWIEQAESSEGDVSPMEYVKANGFLDFPHAWMIARRTALEHHHNECSFRTTDRAILCDCEVLTESPEYVLAYAPSATEGEA